jgi:hypothetical protein
VNRVPSYPLHSLCGRRFAAPPSDYRRGRPSITGTRKTVNKVSPCPTLYGRHWALRRKGTHGGQRDMTPSPHVHSRTPSLPRRTASNLKVCAWANGKLSFMATNLLPPNHRPDRAKWTSADWTQGDGKEDRVGHTGGDQDACDHNGQGLELTHSFFSFVKVPGGA